MSCPSLYVLTVPLVALTIGAEVAAQQRVVFRLGGAIATPSATTTDSGPEVEMFESPNLDRFLRRARQYLEESKFQEAIRLLQAVVEGRTMEAVAPGDTASAPNTTGANGNVAAPTNPTPTPDPREQNGQPPDPRQVAMAAERARALADPAQTVFSADGRLYRPARRLCHEYLASMPQSAIELYRSLYEGRAQDLLDEAGRTGRISDLEAVANRYFVTIAGGRAMQILADRQMHEGRYRAAVQVLRDLATLYPKGGLEALGISPLWCKFKIALCLRLAGEAGAAIEAAQALAAEYPDESLRVMGELRPVRDLANDPIFASGDQQIVAMSTAPRVTATWLDQVLAGATESLVPLWQYRFAGPNPYEAVTGQGSSRDVWSGEVTVANAAPTANKYGTGTQLAFFGRGATEPRAVFLEHYRLRVADAFTGLVDLAGDGDNEARVPNDLRARARVPVYDFTLQRPIEDEERYYAILGRTKVDQTIDSLKVNRLVAYDKSTCQRVWSSESWLEGEDGLLDATFLAAPTVYGERLLVPVLRRGVYELQCLDRRTGQPRWRTRVHAGGSPYYKAPGACVVVAGAIACMLTNAGGIAGVDPFAGDLRWIRKYERNDPLRQSPIVRQGLADGAGYNAFTFVERDLPGALPSDVLSLAGTVVFAACDSDMLFCLDAASGEPVWMLDGTTRYASYGRLRYLVGANSKHLFVATEADAKTWVVCIEHSSGIVLWARQVPGGSEKLTRWRGRGCVLENAVLIPGDREVHVLAADGNSEWRLLPLPSFGVGDEPLSGPNNLYVDGTWLGVSYAKGLEVYSTAAALRQLLPTTVDVVRRAAVSMQAGEPDAALAMLQARLQEPNLAADERARCEEAFVGLTREVAFARGAVGAELLARAGERLTLRSSKIAWRLARIDLLQQLGDMRAYEQEQQLLYRLMEGKDG